MKFSRALATAVYLVFSFLALTPLAHAKDYADPGGTFAVRIPDNWQAQRMQLGDSGWLTQFGTGQEPSESFVIVTFQAQVELGPQMLAPMGKLLIELVLETLKAQGTVTSTEPTPTKFRGRDALRCDITMQQGAAVEKGYLLAMIGKRNAILAAIAAPQNDNAALQRAEAALATLAIETRTPSTGNIENVPAENVVNAPAEETQFAPDIMGALNEMSELVKHQSELLNPPPLTGPDGKTPDAAQARTMFPDANARRLASAAGTLERARAARTAAGLAAIIAWDAFDAGRTDEAAKWFTRRGDFIKENYESSRAFFAARFAANEAKIKPLRDKVPVDSAVSQDRMLLGALLDVQGATASLIQSLARNANDASAMLQWAERELALRREALTYRIADQKRGIAAEDIIFDARLRVAGALELVGDAQISFARFEAAEANYNESLQLRRAVPASYSRRSADVPLRRLALLHSQTGALRRAQDYNLQALQELNATAEARRLAIENAPSDEFRALLQTESLQTIAVLYNNLGSNAMTLGDYKVALDYLQKALATVEPLSPDVTTIPGRARAYLRAAALGNIATAHADSGELDRALREYDDVIKLRRDIGDSESAAIALLNVGGIYFERDSFAEATRYVQQARQLFMAAQNLNGVISTTQFLALLARETNDLPRAASLATESLTLARQLGNTELISSASRTLGTVRLAQNQLDEADALLQEAARADARTGAPTSASSTLIRQGELLEKRNDLNGALGKYKQAIALLESVRATSTSENSFSELKGSYRPYERIVRLLIKMNRAEEAFDYLSRAKSKQLQDNLRLANVQTPDPALQALLDRFNGLETKLRTVATQLQTEQAKPEAERDSAKIENLKLVVATTQGEYRRVFEEIKAKHPNWESNLTIKPRELRETQRSIPPGVVLVQYAPLGEQLYVFVVSKESLKIYTPPAKSDEVWQRIQAVRQLIVQQGNPGVRGAVLRTEMPEISAGGGASLNDHLAALYDMLIAPIEPELANAKTIAFIPNQGLYYLPFHALAKRQGDGVRYLIEDKEVVYLTGADVMRFVQGPDGEKLRGGMVAFGNPTGAELPQALEEVKTIAAIYPNTQVLTGAQVTKGAVLAPGALNKRIVHFATHGVLNSNVPAQSYIQLAKNNVPGSEQLTVNEVWDLPLKQVDLVTLSACETALSLRNPNGGDITTLAEAFSTAGATTVVCSLWSVADDSTKELMVEFYKELAAGQSKAAALRIAQLKVMKNPKYNQAFHWAPFILMGDWR